MLECCLQLKHTLVQYSTKHHDMVSYVVLRTAIKDAEQDLGEDSHKSCTRKKRPVHVSLVQEKL